ncbi:family 43 glycosylhydrolase [Lachnoclostridium sp. Marseille-P6806]|uniref:family 43 glycosylhydrolase n=1 Tax=Lachnoclostridium sp. Marseille-P6806 TaxID=2364793 RepID=UPI0010316E1D|nr:family 43 glycosylhydrolase [Lachnoclostridium sp. Marseille-P6806]
MSRYFCNPVNMSYRYQFNEKPEGGFSLNREAADPSMILFKGKYYIFPSMTCGFLVSDDMVNWRQVPLHDMPVYDYAPDVRAVGDYMYFCASRRGEICDFYRTKDPETEEFEKIPGTFDFWDPDLFLNEDGRLYFYWGCNNVTPIWGVELDPKTMRRIGEPEELIGDGRRRLGYERVGENNQQKTGENRIRTMILRGIADQLKIQPEQVTPEALESFLNHLPEAQRNMLKGALSDAPYIEGAWMTKHDGKYYLQYACPGTEYNIYSDGVYEGESPLGPFHPAANNPFSFEPGGFLPGAGHGSTMQDREGAWWHTATMRISVNHSFERRIGIWPVGFDKDGELFCNQRYGDWPMDADRLAADSFAEPEWMLLSYGKKVTASSEESTSKCAANAVNENVQNWWRAAADDTQQVLTLDLGETEDVRAVQVNFADDFGAVKELPEGAALHGDPGMRRYIEKRKLRTRWLLETSVDGVHFEILKDKRAAETDLPHDIVIREQGVRVRYVRLTVAELPYGQKACVSGLRVFGLGNGTAPAKAADVTAVRGEDRRNAVVSWKSEGTGCEVLWGHDPDKLYHSWRVFRTQKAEQQNPGQQSLEIRAIDADTAKYWVRVDAFNESGITHGDVVEMK